MSAPQGFNYQQSLLPEGTGSITAMSGGGGEEAPNSVANQFLQLVLKTCANSAKDFTLKDKALVKETDTRLR